MSYDPERHQRRSTRRRGWDYRSVGAYFLTIVTHERGLLFGVIHDGAMNLSPLGRIAADEWVRTAVVRQHIRLDEFVVMPNHIHAILWIVNLVHGVNTEHMRRHGQAERHGRPIGPAPDSVGAILAQYKSVSAKRINRVRKAPGAPVWQRSYHDRIVRNVRELEAKRRYIRNNPSRWSHDPENLG